MQAAAADDEEVGISGRSDEGRDRLIEEVLEVTGDHRGQALVDAAVGNDRPQLGVEALGNVARGGVGGGRLGRAVDPYDDRAWKFLPGVPCNEHRAGRLVDQLGRSRAHDDAMSAAVAVAADRDQRVLLATDLANQFLPRAAPDDLAGRLALAELRLNAAKASAALSRCKSSSR